MNNNMVFQTEIIRNLWLWNKRRRDSVQLAKSGCDVTEMEGISRGECLLDRRACGRCQLRGRAWLVTKQLNLKLCSNNLYVKIIWKKVISI